MSTMFPFDQAPKHEPKKWKGKAEMRERRLLFKVERDIGPVENFTFNQCVLKENALKNTSRKKGLPIKIDRSSTQEVEFVSLDYRKINSPRRKKAGTIR